MRRYISESIAFLMLVLSATAALAEEPTALNREEAAPALFDIDLASSDVSFFTSGSWKGTVTGSSALSLTDMGWQFASTDAPVLFAQEIDLTLELTINERWFVETSFLDDYDLNTYRAGYRGKPGEPVQYVGIGNKGLDFPVFPWLDLGGDAPNSFGIYGKFGTGPLSLHALVRYDAAVREERVFIGDRERTTTEKAISDRLKGRAFVLPDKGLDSTPVVYIEDADGSYTGSDGRKYRIADSDEFAASATLGIVELDKTPSGRVIVAYTLSGSTTPWTTSLGTYGTSTSPGTGFLGSAQSAFSSTSSEVSLEDLPQPGGTAKPATITINGTSALAVWEPGCFSPFEVANRYASPSSATSTVSAALIQTSSGTRVENWELTLRSSSQTSYDIQTGTSTSSLSSSSTTWELLPATSSRDRRSEVERWPLLSEAPEIYLPGSRGTTTDLSLRFYSYGLVSGYTIGTEIVPSSVRVTRDGILDGSAVYNSSSGVVTLGSPANANELIKISYLKKSDERRFGSLAAGLGAVFENGGPLSLRAAMGMRWNISGDTFSEYGSNNPGNVTLCASGDWKGKSLTARLATALSYDQSDTSGLYRAAGMEDEALTIEPVELDYKPSEVPEDQTDLTSGNQGNLIYRDYTVSNYLGGSSLQGESYDASVVSSEEGPYPIADSSFSNGVLAAEFDLDASDIWAGFQVVLPSAASSLERAEQILLPIRFTSTPTFSNDFQIWLEIGALADSDEDEYESTELVCSRLLFSTDSADSGEAAFTGTTPPTTWQLLTLSLSDAERAALADPRSMRIVVRFKDAPAAAASLSGRLLVGSPIVVGSLWRPILDTQDGIITAPDPSTGRGAAAAEDAADSSIQTGFSGKLDRLHPDSEEQRVLAVSWGSLKEDEAGGVDREIDALPLSSYKELHLLVKGPSTAASTSTDALRIIVGYDPLDPDGAVLDVSVPASAFTAGTWSELNIQYARTNPRVLVDGTAVSGAQIGWHRKKLQRYGGDDPTWVAVLIVPASGTTLADGTFSIDELTLEESLGEYAADLSGSETWKHSGPILTIKGTPLLSDIENEASFSSRVSGNPFDAEIEDNTAVAASGKEKLSLSLFALRTTGTIAVSTGESGSSWSGSHSLSLPLGPLSLAENFELSPDDLTSRHGLSVNLKSPASLSLSAKTDQEDSEMEQSWKAGISGRLPLASGQAIAGSDSRFTLAATWLSADTEAQGIDNPYFTSWLDSFGNLIPDRGTSAKKRNMGADGTLNLGGNRSGASLGISTSTNYSRFAEELLSKGSINLTIPFLIRDIRFTAGFSRSYTRTDDSSSAAADEDLDTFFRAQGNASSLWLTAPFTALGDQHLRSILAESAEDSLDATFNDTVSGSIQMKPPPGPLALLIPSFARLGVERAIEQDLDTLSDSLILTSSLRASATNLFGSFGHRPLFSFYKTDEFSQSLDGKVVLREDSGATEGNSWQFSLNQSAAFFGQQESELNLTNALVIASSSGSDGATLSWTRSAQNSVLNWLYGEFIDLAGEKSPWIGNIAKETPSRLYRESMAFSWARAEDATVTWSGSAKHETIVRVPGRISLSTFILTALSGDDSTELTIALSAGITLNLSF